jgi:hypothetical protein
MNDRPASARKRALTAAVAFVLSSSWLVHAQSARPRDYEVKAVYLYNFGRFATWPPTVAAADDSVFPVCVLGRDPFGASLDAALAGETIGGKRVVARRLTKPQDAVGCRILFVSASEEAEWLHILKVIDSTSMLTVSDMPQFVARGGMIQFVFQDNRVRFEVNLAAAEQASLTLSSDLLKVATAVRRGPGPGG